MNRIPTVRNSVLALLIGSLLTACGLKSKTELYLERGLDILSNKKQVEFTLTEGVEIEELGVIRDKKEGKKVLVFRMHPSTHQDALSGYTIGLKARIRGENDSVRIELWDFDPNLQAVKSNQYLTRDIYMKEDKIQKLNVYLYLAGDVKKQRIGDLLVVQNLWTYND
jgi:hypothetical protein